MNSNILMTIGLGIINAITLPLLVYTFKSVINKIDKLDEKMEQVSTDISTIVNRVVVIETACALRSSSKGKKC